jgi:hypothetical protein
LSTGAGLVLSSLPGFSKSQSGTCQQGENQ